MSTPTESGAAGADGEGRRMSLGKYVKRMSSVFKREKPARGSSATAPTAPSVPEVEPKVARQEPAQVEAAPATKPPTDTRAPTTTASTVAPPLSPAMTSQIDRRAMQQERARALFAKYGLTLESHEWITAPAPVPPVQRVEKSIRMRVHRSCHHCGAIYGAEKVCFQCEHKRCKKCPRYPPKKRTEKEKENDEGEKPKKKRVLTVTTRAGNELAYQPPKQRVKRTCHKCETPFVPPTATICEQCRHIRCTKCPRDPAKLQKWPIGYPGDVEADSDSEVEKQLEKFRRTWRKPRQRVRWECEHCHSSFINGSPQCPGCGHERCDKCTRSPIKKARKEEKFDPKLVAAVEAKLRALDVESDVPLSGVQVA
ncbi:hypothetical protein FB567DRAFT_329213 [Paraphoma chrysanthemicola]|uniref:Uncharacterized protein n=1 Tax=Paraphoma chrysanthemicola TaxID=798071 RepID=A0A8K0R8G4_9PLEO|nr:hypothetical protein FB567DRAFT_329213 [Paraphoma chrysanthemicola]